MQTPSHAAISLFFWRHSIGWRQTLSVVAGAVLPDLNMFLFYGYQKLIGSSEAEIWGTLYFQDHWQLFFDLFNSIPIYAAIAGLAYWRGWRIVFLVSASALVHVLCDLPVHNDDAHRHFLPLSSYRFISPVSYWDPKHFGLYAASVEFVVCTIMCVRLSFGDFVKSIRISGRINLLLYALAGIAIAGFLMRSFD